MSAENQVRVFWTLNGTPDVADFPSNVTWAHVRTYIWDVRVKSGQPVPPENIHVRPRLRARF